MKGGLIQLSALRNFAENLVAELKKTKERKAVVLLLSGDLGAGKTTLTQEIARVLGVTENVISPTFIIKKIYKTEDSRFKYLIHVDAYRLSSEKEAEILRLSDDLKNDEALIIIEWADQINWKKKDAEIRISIEGEEERNMEIIYERS